MNQKTNVAPGDLAIIVNAPAPYSGLIVEIVSHPSSDDFYLPNGMNHFGVKEFSKYWVIKFRNPMPARAHLSNGEVCKLKTEYGVAPDRDLRRIAGPSVITETETDQPVEVAA